MVSRWDDLSAALARWHDRQTNDSFVAGRYATIIGNAFAEYVGTPDGPRFFEYKPDKYDQDQDEFSLADNGFAAVMPSLDGRWQFGLAVC